MALEGQNQVESVEKSQKAIDKPVEGAATAAREAYEPGKAKDPASAKAETARKTTELEKQGTLPSLELTADAAPSEKTGKDIPKVTGEWRSMPSPAEQPADRTQPAGADTKRSLRVTAEWQAMPAPERQTATQSPDARQTDYSPQTPDNAQGQGGIKSGGRQPGLDGSEPNDAVSPQPLEATGSAESELDTHKQVRAMAFNEGGTRLAAAPGETAYKLKGGDIVTAQEDGSISFERANLSKKEQLNPDGTLVTYTKDANGIWQQETSNLAERENAQAEGRQPRVSKDGTAYEEDTFSDGTNSRYFLRQDGWQILDVQEPDGRWTEVQRTRELRDGRTEYRYTDGTVDYLQQPVWSPSK